MDKELIELQESLAKPRRSLSLASDRMNKELVRNLSESSINRLKSMSRSKLEIDKVSSHHKSVTSKSSFRKKDTIVLIKNLESGSSLAKVKSKTMILKTEQKEKENSSSSSGESKESKKS